MIIAWVYILTNANHTVLYIGLTIDLATRVWEHRTKQNKKSFTAKYNVDKLIYFEEFQEIEAARKREIFLKKKTLKWKIDLINQLNPSWTELNPNVSRLSQIY
ncbi:MAG TPA: GIY-YIG nuclease family protein [Chryseosolibacter sp.]